MLNFVALYAVGYLVRGPLQEPLRIYPQSPTLPLAGRLPVLVPGTRLHAGFALAALPVVFSPLIRMRDMPDELDRLSDRNGSPPSPS